jgi:hypothetical protein
MQINSNASCKRCSLSDRLTVVLLLETIFTDRYLSIDSDCQRITPLNADYIHLTPQSPVMKGCEYSRRNGFEDV